MSKTMKIILVAMSACLFALMLSACGVLDNNKIDEIKEKAGSSPVSIFYAGDREIRADRGGTIAFEVISTGKDVDTVEFDVAETEINEAFHQTVDLSADSNSIVEVPMKSELKAGSYEIVASAVLPHGRVVKCVGFVEIVE